MITGKKIMAMASLQAVVIGGTGSCGMPLVASLLKSKDSVSKVTLMSRKRLEELPGVDVAAEEREGRLVQHIEDLDTVSDDTVRQLCTGAHVFCNTLGTTRAIAGSAAAFRHIDMEIPERLSRLAREAGVKHCSVLTSKGANASSWFLYLKTKGQLENSLREMGFPNLSIFRPGALNRGANQRSFMEKVINLVITLLPVELVGRAMAVDAITHHSSSTDAGEMVANNDAILRLSQTAVSTAETAATSQATDQAQD